MTRDHTELVATSVGLLCDVDEGTTIAEWPVWRRFVVALGVDGMLLGTPGVVVTVPVLDDGQHIG